MVAWKNPAIACVSMLALFANPGIAQTSTRPVTQQWPALEQQLLDVLADAKSDVTPERLVSLRRAGGVAMGLDHPLFAEAAMPHFLRLLRGGALEEREIAAKAIADILCSHDEQQNETLARLMAKKVAEDESPSVKDNCVRGLSYRPHPAALDDLACAMDDRRNPARMQLTWVLLAMGRSDPAALTPVVKCVSDADPRLRSQGYMALALRDGAKAADEIIAAVETERKVDGAVAWRGAIVALAKIRHPKATERLLRILDEDLGADNVLDPVRDIIAEELAARPADPRLIDVMRRRLGDCREAVRAHAATALGNYGDKDAAPLLRQRLKEDRRPRVRTAAAGALGKLKDAAAVELLAQAMTQQPQDDGRLSETAMHALAKIATPECIKALYLALGGYHPPQLYKWWHENGQYLDQYLKLYDEQSVQGPDAALFMIVAMLESSRKTPKLDDKATADAFVAFLSKAPHLALRERHAPTYPGILTEAKFYNGGFVLLTFEQPIDLRDRMLGNWHRWRALYRLRDGKYSLMGGFDQRIFRRDEDAERLVTDAEAKESKIMGR